jgi:CRISPR-associated endonuclease/helicase Cas3
MTTDQHFTEFFGRLAGGKAPHDWQISLSAQRECGNRLIRIPTGLGKTLGVVGTWLWHSWHQRDSTWPHRLVICLPMRVLVEQTEAEVRDALIALNALWDQNSDHEGKIGLHVLMGGIDRDEWYLFPEHFAVLICTQDMGLSAALNRGYGVPRARWPAEFGLLSQDTLWVMDEVQLMDVGLATSAQLQAFRDDDRAQGKAVRPAFTWWMSATLQRDWLAKSPDTQALARDLSLTRIAADRRSGHLWTDVSKPCRVENVNSIKALAALVTEQHVECGRGRDGPTLVVLNTVERAVALFQELRKRAKKELRETDIRLAHGRFRLHERKAWRETFLKRSACTPGTDRVIIATQVVEAGVDISAALMITELAPWASLVQRAGRCARWGGRGQVIVIDFGYADDKRAAPYTAGELNAARDALTLLTDVAPLYLESFEEEHPELLPTLYPYEPKHLLLRHELDELFDTTPDLSGADVDISRFIRSGDDRDVQVFWADVPSRQRPPATLQPTRSGLCTVPFLKVREWLFAKQSEGRFEAGKRAWVWDWIDGEWIRAQRSDIYPGRVVLVSSESGGYDIDIGWEPKAGKHVVVVPEGSLDAAELIDQQSDASEDSEALSTSNWQTIAIHGREVGRLAYAIARALGVEKATLFALGGHVHDGGKAHPAFQDSIERPSDLEIAGCRELAKAPRSVWLPLKQLYPIKDANGQVVERRQGFRHELASVLMLFSVLRRHAPDHSALLGPYREFLKSAAMASPSLVSMDMPITDLEREIIELSTDDFNLLAYLVCAHHGKVRVTWHASAADQAAASGLPRIRGIASDDTVPPVRMVAADGRVVMFPESRLDLAPATVGLNPVTGMAWTERVLHLLEHHGPFALAWLEALLIAADRRTSRRSDIHDDLLFRADRDGGAAS